MTDLSAYRILAEFTACVRRPVGQRNGMLAQLWAENGAAADAVLALGRSELLDATVDVDLAGGDGQTLGGFQAQLRRPQPRVSGMLACFFAENGEHADAITALSLSKYLDAVVRATVRLVRHADGRSAEQPVSGPHGEAAARLYRSGFLGTPAVWRAAGTDEEYLEWCRAQPCCVKSAGPCGGDIVPMHVRRVANGAGMAAKPDYSAIPGCVRHHDMQHAQGESAVGGKEFYDRQRVVHLRLWVWNTIKRNLGAASMADVEPARVRAWARDRGVEHCLPINY